MDNDMVRRIMIGAGRVLHFKSKSPAIGRERRFQFKWMRLILGLQAAKKTRKKRPDRQGEAGKDIRSRHTQGLTEREDHHSGNTGRQGGKIRNDGRFGGTRGRCRQGRENRAMNRGVHLNTVEQTG